MEYLSTRGHSQHVSAAQAIVQGLAKDGGLFVPETFPQWSLDRIQGLVDLSYKDVSRSVLSDYLTDFTNEEIIEMTSAAYGNQFDDASILPIYMVDQQENVLEIYHGPTLAFKDIALQILPYLMKKSMQKIGETKKVLILVATSGDTGKAALEGFQDVEDTAMIVFYPQDGVSAAQKLQMMTQEGDNVYVCGVNGNFDDAQSGVKRIFSDPAMAQKLEADGYRLSSANSINWGRLLPQIAYYFWSYAQLIKEGRLILGEIMNVSVPTGNFGNILAGYYAKQMGLPIGKLICASNQNNVLTDFFNQGTYDRNRDFYKTTSPSMDILISSNLERLLFELTDRDGSAVSSWMNSLKTNGAYAISDGQKARLDELFYASWSDDEMGARAIRYMFEEYDYLIDPHTAIAQIASDIYMDATNDKSQMMVLSTASPYKFAGDVVAALREEEARADVDAFALCDELSALTQTNIPNAILNLKGKPICHTDICEASEMDSVVLRCVQNWK